MKPDETVDCTGMRCPRPIVEMAKKMKTLQPGQVLELIATDSVARKDVPAWCQKTGNELLEQKEAGGEFRFYVRKKCE